MQKECKSMSENTLNIEIQIDEKIVSAPDFKNLLPLEERACSQSLAHKILYFQVMRFFRNLITKKKVKTAETSFLYLSHVGLFEYLLNSLLNIWVI